MYFEFSRRSRSKSQPEVARRKAKLLRDSIKRKLSIFPNNRLEEGDTMTQQPMGDEKKPQKLLRKTLQCKERTNANNHNHQFDDDKEGDTLSVSEFEYVSTHINATDTNNNNKKSNTTANNILNNNICINNVDSLINTEHDNKEKMFTKSPSKFKPNGSANNHYQHQHQHQQQQQQAKKVKFIATNQNDSTIVSECINNNNNNNNNNNKDNNNNKQNKKFPRNLFNFNKNRNKNEAIKTNDESDRMFPIVQFDNDGDIPVESNRIKNEFNDVDKKYLNNGKDGGGDDSRKDSLDGGANGMNVDGINTQKIRTYVKVVLKYSFSQIGLAGLVIGYVVLGSLIFMKIESNYEKQTQKQIQHNREEFYRDVRIAAEHIVNEYLRVNFHYKYNQYRNEELNGHVTNNNNDTLSERSFSIFNKIINENNNDNANTANGNGNGNGTSTKSKPPKYIKEKLQIEQQNSIEPIKKNSWFVKIDEELFRNEMSYHLKVFLNENDKIEDKDKNALLREEVWTYSSALLYSATVITTIGYGNITPKSSIGKIFTMIYAMIGIPLMFMCLTNTGDLLAELFINVYTKTIRFFYRRLCRHRLRMLYSSTKFTDTKKEMLTDFEMEYDNPNDRHVPVLATIGVLVAYIFTGAVIFSYWENWSYLDGAYFCFITFTTIGFGDFVPGKNTLSTDKGGKAALCTLYLLAGMVIMAMCFKLMQDEVFSKARWLGIKLGIISK